MLRSLIYIPLCFYFIHCCSIIQRIDVDIYIPLCFYFICSSCRWSSHSERIYIPLCFYFISFPKRTTAEDDKFTFHYASTLSRPRTEMEGLVAYLHSTMLLLYRIQLLTDGMRKQYLHSTMLLLYRLVAIAPSHISRRFTFHYASTLSGPLSPFLRPHWGFTFHYASTLS